MALVHGAQEPLGVRDGLVLYLDAANARSYPRTGNTWFDRSGNGNNGTLNGAGYSNLNGGSLTFDGSDDYVQKTSATTNLSAGVTMEIIFKSTDMNSRAQGIIQFSGTDNFIDFYTPGNGKLRWEAFHPVGRGVQILSPAALSNNTWYHAVGTYVSGVGVLYINGNSVISGTDSGGTGNFSSSYTGNIIIGQYAGYLSGNIAKVSIYNRALTATEIAQNYNALKGRYGLT